MRVIDFVPASPIPYSTTTSIGKPHAGSLTRDPEPLGTVRHFNPLVRLRIRPVRVIINRVLCVPGPLALVTRPCGPLHIEFSIGPIVPPVIEQSLPAISNGHVPRMGRDVGGPKPHPVDVPKVEGANRKRVLFSRYFAVHTHEVSHPWGGEQFVCVVKAWPHVIAVGARGLKHVCSRRFTASRRHAVFGQIVVGHGYCCCFRVAT